MKEKLEALDREIERTLNNQKEQRNLKYYVVSEINGAFQS